MESLVKGLDGLEGRFPDVCFPETVPGQRSRLTTEISPSWCSSHLQTRRFAPPSRLRLLRAHPASPSPRSPIGVFFLPLP